MKTTLMRWLLPIIILVLAAVAAKAMIEMKPPVEKKEETTRAPLVKTQAVKPESLFFTIHSQGSIQPRLDSTITAEVSGKIVFVSEKFVHGGLFVEGETIIKVETFDYETALQAAQAEVARAQSLVTEERAKAKVAETEWLSLMRGEAPDLYLRKPQLAREIATLQSAQAAVEKAQRDLDRTVIKAPFSALVTEKFVELGQFITTGTNITRLYGTDTAEIRLPVPDRDLAFLSLSASQAAAQQLPVSLSAQIGQQFITWQAQITRTEGVISTENRMTYLIGTIHDPYALAHHASHPPLQFGRFVKAEIQGVNVDDIIVLPRNLLLTGDRVLVAKNDALHIAPVNVLRKEPQQVYIRSGLHMDDLIVTSSIPNPIPGMKVRIQQGLSTTSSETVKP